MSEGGIELPFAGGQFRFYLPMPKICAIERGPIDKGIVVRQYPVSFFQLYDELKAGTGVSVDGSFVLLSGATIHPSDVAWIIQNALEGGNSGVMEDGEPFEVGPQLAARLVREHVLPPCPLSSGAALAFAILHAAIEGVQVKKADGAGEKPRPRPSQKGRS